MLWDAPQCEVVVAAQCQSIVVLPALCGDRCMDTSSMPFLLLCGWVVVVCVFFGLWCFFFNTQVSAQAADISGTTFLQFQVFSCHLLTSLCSVLSCCCPVGHDLLCYIKVEIICKSNMY